MIVDGQVVIMAVDPGDTTGWCWLAVDRGDLCSLGTRGFLKKSDLRYGQFKTGGTDAGENFVVDLLVESARRCWDWAEVDVEEDTFLVVLEDFILRNSSMDRSLLSPVRLNAKLQYALRNSGIRTVLQSSSDAMRTVTDDRLRIWNLYDSASGVHARDATRHAVLCARKYASDIRFREWCGMGLRDAA